MVLRAGVNFPSPQREGESLFEAHREVEGANVLGQRPNGDEINAGLGEFTDRFERHVAGYFKLGFAVGQFYCLAHLLGFEVIKHDDIGAGLDSLLQLLQVFDFHFDGHIRMQPEGFSTA